MAAAVGGGDSGGGGGGGGAAVVPYTLTLGYDHFDAGEALQALLPPGLLAPSSFQTAGHVIQLNLDPPLLPHRFLIGRVLLDKLRPRVRTVVNKAASVGSAVGAPPALSPSPRF